MYERIDDALDKAEFYLKREELWKQIALNGYQKVKEYFSYGKQLEKMFECKYKV